MRRRALKAIAIVALSACRGGDTPGTELRVALDTTRANSEAVIVLSGLGSTELRALRNLEPELAARLLRVSVAGQDSTPLVGPASYCAAIGFTDGRTRCPVRQEGATDRSACETDAVGRPLWSGPGQVDPANQYSWWVPRGTGGTVSVCASKHPNVCGSVEVEP